MERLINYDGVSTGGKRDTVINMTNVLENALITNDGSADYVHPEPIQMEPGVAVNILPPIKDDVLGY